MRGNPPPPPPPPPPVKGRVTSDSQRFVNKIYALPVAGGFVHYLRPSRRGGRREIEGKSSSPGPGGGAQGGMGRGGGGFIAPCHSATLNARRHSVRLQTSALCVVRAVRVASCACPSENCPVLTDCPSFLLFSVVFAVEIFEHCSLYRAGEFPPRTSILAELKVSYILRLQTKF